MRSSENALSTLVAMRQDLSPSDREPDQPAQGALAEAPCYRLRQSPSSTDRAPAAIAPPCEVASPRRAASLCPIKSRRRLRQPRWGSRRTRTRRRRMQRADVQSARSTLRGPRWRPRVRRRGRLRARVSVGDSRRGPCHWNTCIGIGRLLRGMPSVNTVTLGTPASEPRRRRPSGSRCRSRP